MHLSPVSSRAQVLGAQFLDSVGFLGGAASLMPRRFVEFTVPRAGPTPASICYLLIGPRYQLSPPSVTSGHRDHLYFSPSFWATKCPRWASLAETNSCEECAGPHPCPSVTRPGALNPRNRARRCASCRHAPCAASFQTKQRLFCKR